MYFPCNNCCLFEILFDATMPHRNLPSRTVSEAVKYFNQCFLSQSAIDPGGEQIWPSGAQQHGDHPAHHEPVLWHWDLRGGERCSQSYVMMFCTRLSPMRWSVCRGAVVPWRKVTSLFGSCVRHSFLLLLVALVSVWKERQSSHTKSPVNANQISPLL